METDSTQQEIKDGLPERVGQWMRDNDNHPSCDAPFGDEASRQWVANQAAAFEALVRVERLKSDERNRLASKITAALTGG